jgi:hypothetical protein
MTGGAKILVDHEADDMSALLSELGANAFVLYREVAGGSLTQARAIIVASGQVAVVRPLDELSTQSTTFRPKR